MRIGIYNSGTPSGIRAVEHFYLANGFDVKVIARTLKDIAPVSRFAAEFTVATDIDSLAKSLDGCDVVVDCADSCEQIQNSAEVYRAASLSGVRRFIYVSNMFANHPPADPAPNPTANETLLLSQAQESRTELTILRPGNLYGPRCYWSLQVADELHHAYQILPLGGMGLFNGTYIGNLVRAIRDACAAESSAVAGKTFWVTDGAANTWQDFFLQMAKAISHTTGLPCQPNICQNGSGDQSPQFTKAKLETLKLMQKLPLPYRVRMRAEGNLRRLSDWQWKQLAQSYKKIISIENTKQAIGYNPDITLEEGCLATAGWLNFAEKLAGWQSKQ